MEGWVEAHNLFSQDPLDIFCLAKAENRIPVICQNLRKGRGNGKDGVERGGSFNCSNKPTSNYSSEKGRSILPCCLLFFLLTMALDYLSKKKDSPDIGWLQNQHFISHGLIPGIQAPA